MRKAILFVLLFVLGLWAQDKAQVTVKSSQTTGGVVLIVVSENGKQLELQCTDQQAWCTSVKAGTYQMVRLPKNHGMYDCQNVDLYSASANVDTDQKLGEYCLNQ
jgi:hypothetical protein